jgi:single-stranded DNA-binding protein
MAKDVTHIIGNAGGKAEMGDTKIGPVCRVSVAVTKSYPSTPGADDGEMRWVKVANFKPSVQAQMMAQIDKGTVVIAEGVIEKSEYQGKAQFSMKASRVGLGEYFLPSAEDKAAAAKRFGDTKAKVETEEESW